ncbi:glutaredoxin family protein [Mycobacteroides abscessus]|uniref:Glutaredoxin n=1 Tax=Mycobacteroides abscessus TaxID=36809 RepID=A0AB33SZQ1_9MYCO|nr:glutaredoxin family protein [Mycobacteroides abscessus]CPT03778.1 glutaredoxin [Mycobacteroides abscessus]CPT67825.1 glutaredoxin [Mycobacteroides abscessus]CPT69058.1 glutaredoxin [Mycobacteroides abscessus]CPV12582.1 glutaredoxin [Mycobacteroides abscessus]CPV59419.1 glutaredoxin [Mycobacteroides abscessus]
MAATLSAVVFTKPGCGPCLWVKKSLEQYGVPYTDRDVTTDPAAEATLRSLYAGHRPGQHPATPVTLLATPDGAMTVFGPDIRKHLRDATRAVDAA